MTQAAVVACVFYRDPVAAMRWLEQAFGFETSMLLTDAEGRVGHAEMTFLGAVITFGPEWSGPQIGRAEMKSPASLGGVGTQFLRVHMPDGIDDHHARARDAGAEITQAPEDQFYGARTYRALDLEGHVWNFSQVVKVVDLDEVTKGTGLKHATSLEGA